MVRQLYRSVTILVGLLVTTAATQQGPAVAGAWIGKSTIGPNDSVAVIYVLRFGADGKSATLLFPNRAPIPTRIVAVGGDSIVTEAGPYPSILRAGQTVKSLRNILHVKADTMTGTFEATYANGDVVKGKTKAKRAK
ncbi:MAG TPA: hypothetical protein VEU55_09925 [Gemmatimonadales bacterium]|nr:hypothetical protein [Gemmatimonadales bacterium]